MIWDNPEKACESWQAELAKHVTGSTPEDDRKLCTLALRIGNIAREAQTEIEQAFAYAREGKMDLALARLQPLANVDFYRAARLLLLLEAKRQKSMPPPQKDLVPAERVITAIRQLGLENSKEQGDNLRSVDMLFQAQLFKDWNEWWGNFVGDILSPPQIAYMIKLSRPASGFGDVPDEVLHRLAIRFVQTGRWERAEIIHALEDSVEKLVALADVMALLPRGKASMASQLHKEACELIPTALATLASRLDDPEKYMALAKVLQASCELGHKDEAEQITQQFRQCQEKVTSAWEKTFILSQSASALSRAGEKEQAVGLFRECLQLVAQQTSDFDKIKLLETVVEQLDTLSYFPELLEIVQSIATTLLPLGKEVIRNSGCLLYLPRLFSLAQAPEKARETLSQIVTIVRIAPSNDMDKGIVLEFLARYLLLHAEEKEIVQALAEESKKIAQSLSHDTEGSALVLLAGTLAMFGEAAPAMELVAKVPEKGNRRLSALYAIVLGLAKAGKEDQACQIFQKTVKLANVKAEVAQESVLVDMAQAFAEVGELDRALATGQTISQDTEKTKALAAIAASIAQNAQGQTAWPWWQKLIEITTTIKDGFSRSRALVDLAKEVEKSRQHELYKARLLLRLIEEARKTPPTLFAPYDLAEIAYSLARIGEKKKAKQIFEQILPEMQPIPNFTSKPAAVAKMARACAEIGEPGEALKSIARMEESKPSSDKGQVSLQLAQKFLQQGNWEKAQELCQEVLNQTSADSPLLSVAENLEVVAKSGCHTLFTDFLSRQTYSARLAAVVASWRKTLLIHIPDLMALRRTFLIAPCDYALAYQGIRTLEIAHIRQKNWQHYEEIEKGLQASES